MAHTTRAVAIHRPVWRLVALTALVLLAHWAVLRAIPLAMAARADPNADQSWAFTTRTIAASGSNQPVSNTANPPATAPTRRAPGLRQTPLVTSPDRQLSDALAAQSRLPTAAETPETTVSAETRDVEPTMQLADAAQSITAAGQAPHTKPVGEARPIAAKAVQKFVFPPSAQLKYDVKGEIKGFPYHVNGELKWVQDGNTYDARMEISHFLLGSRVQTSTGQLGLQGLEPTRFGDKVRSEVAAHFERGKGKIIFSANTPDVALLPGAQDQLSVLLQLSAMLAAEPHRFPKATTLPFQAVGPRSAESWVFHVGASEKLVLPGGELSALRLWRDPIGEYDPKLEVWLAPDMGYLPVRIRLTQANGDVVDQQWRATLK